MRKLRVVLFVVLIIVLAILLAVSCNGQGVTDSVGGLCISTWNVQNLFNAEVDGNEYDEYKPSAGWSQSAYETRLSNASRVLACLPSAGFHIMVLNEIENPDVVEDLIKTGILAKMGIRYYACAGSGGGAIQTAVISSIPICSARIHETGEDVRPILEAGFDIEGGKLFVLAVHFKSNVGGVAETASKRASQASVVRDVARQIRQDNPGCLVLVCGDMNEECWDENALGRGDGAVLKVGSSFAMDTWYCFWLDSRQNIWPLGSYMYDGHWKCYDNILVSSAGNDGTGWEFESCGVVFESFQKTSDSKPFAWDRNLLRGVSDHLPVWVTFKLI